MVVVHLPSQSRRQLIYWISTKRSIGILVRSAAVDSSGRELNRNRLIALMSAIVLEEVCLFLIIMSYILVVFP